MYIITLIVLSVIFVVLDQITKLMAIASLKGQPSIPIIKDVFELSYVENPGAAFGIMKNSTIFFIITTVIILGLVIYYYIKMPNDKKYNWLRFSLILIVAGAIGNFIDRVFRGGYVVDFLYFKLINFPVFNVADCYVVVGTILLAILLLFVYKNDSDVFMERK